MRVRPGAGAAGWVLAVLLSPAAAEAHIVSARFGDFYGGVMHPLTAIEDVVLFAALGLVAGMQAPGRARWLVPALPLGTLAGAVVALSGVDPGLGGLSRAALAESACMVLLGVLLAAAVTLPASLVVALAVLIGGLRGLANASGLPAGTNVPLFVLGMMLTGYALAVLAAALTIAFRRGAGWHVIAVRACGSWVAAVGVMVATFAIRSW